MTRKWFCSLLAIFIVLAISACAPQYTEPEASYPTLPSFPEEQSPAQQLEAAIAKTEAEESYEICYGTVRQSEEENTEDSDSQTVSKDSPLNLEEMYEKLPYLPDNENFLQDFCNRSLRAIPSNTGIIRYQLTDLSWEDAQSLLYSQPREGEFDEAMCAVALELDADGRFSQLEITMETENAEFTVFLTITFPDTP